MNPTTVVFLDDCPEYLGPAANPLSLLLMPLGCATILEGLCAQTDIGQAGTVAGGGPGRQQ